MSSGMSKDVFEPADELLLHLQTILRIGIDATVQIPVGIVRSAIVTVALDKLVKSGYEICFVSVPIIVKQMKTYNPDFDCCTPNEFRTTKKDYDIVFCETPDYVNSTNPHHQTIRLVT